VSRLGRIADLVINKGVELSDILLLVLYSFPAYLTFTFPMAFLLSTIVVLGRLSGENEILVSRERHRLALPAVPFGAWGLPSHSSAYSTPQSSFQQRGIGSATGSDIAKKSISVEDKEGVFNDSIPRVVIYIGKVDKENTHPMGILISTIETRSQADDLCCQRHRNLDPTRWISHSPCITAASTDGKRRMTYTGPSVQNYLFSMKPHERVAAQRELRRKNTK